MVIIIYHLLILSTPFKIFVTTLDILKMSPKGLSGIFLKNKLSRGKLRFSKILKRQDFN